MGYRKGGWPGLILAGVCFILPRGRSSRSLRGPMFAMEPSRNSASSCESVKPVIIIVVLQAMCRSERQRSKTPLLAAIAIGSVVLSAAGFHELMVLLLAGVGGALASRVHANSAHLVCRASPDLPLLS